MVRDAIFAFDYEIDFLGIGMMLRDISQCVVGKPKKTNVVRLKGIGAKLRPWFLDFRATKCAPEMTTI